MKKNTWRTTVVFILLIFIVPTINVPQATATNNIKNYPFTAEGIILMDAKTGEVLFSRNKDKTLYPASTTKIMTAILAMESDQLDEKAVTSKKARHAIGNRIYLAEGEEKPLIDLVYGIMLNSGNDAAIVIAEHLAGSVEEFAEQMNNKARQIGAENTHFTNPHGLHDDNHYTTAQDMAKIAQYALTIPELREIITTRTMPWFGDEWHSMLVNTNQLLRDYDGITGMKTGYTMQARSTFVASAERDGTELIVVLLNTPQRKNIWKESTVLLDYGFEHYETVKIKTAGQPVKATINNESHILELGENLYLTIEKSDEEKNMDEMLAGLKEVVQLDPVNAFGPPLQKGKQIGKLQMMNEDEIVVSEAPLKLTRSIYASTPTYAQKIGNKFTFEGQEYAMDEYGLAVSHHNSGSFLQNNWFKIVLFVIGLAASYVLGNLYRRRQSKQLSVAKYKVKNFNYKYYRTNR